MPVFFHNFTGRVGEGRGFRGSRAWGSSVGLGSRGKVLGVTGLGFMVSHNARALQHCKQKAQAFRALECTIAT